MKLLIDKFKMNADFFHSSNTKIKTKKKYTCLLFSIFPKAIKKNYTPQKANNLNV